MAADHLDSINRISYADHMINIHFEEENNIVSQLNRLGAAVLRVEGASVQSGVEERLQRAVEELPVREREVVVRRWALEGGKPALLSDLADDLGITNERVRQLEVHALAQLRTVLENDD